MRDGLSEKEATVWESYRRMRALLEARLSRELHRATGLSEADYEVLIALASSREGTMRALELRCGLQWEKSRLSHQLRRMERRGLVVREECAEDRRGTVIRVTGAGCRLAGEARRHYERAVRRHVIEALSAEQVEALGEISRALLAGLRGLRRP